MSVKGQTFPIREVSEERNENSIEIEKLDRERIEILDNAIMRRHCLGIQLL